MPTLLVAVLMLAGQGGFVPITDKDIDQLSKFWLSAAEVVKADRALQKRLAERQKRQEEKADEGPEVLTQAIVQEPKLKKALIDAGMKPERFGPAMTTFFLAAGMVGMKRAGQMKEYPAEFKQVAQLVEKRYKDVEKVGAAMKEIEKLAEAE